MPGKGNVWSKLCGIFCSDQVKIEGEIAVTNGHTVKNVSLTELAGLKKAYLNIFFFFKN